MDIELQPERPDDLIPSEFIWPKGMVLPKLCSYRPKSDYAAAWSRGIEQNQISLGNPIPHVRSPSRRLESPNIAVFECNLPVFESTRREPISFSH